jgi:pimeloyl-ACP methyl ester carboxylesterase
VAISIAPEREPRLSVGRVLMDPDRIERDEPDWAARLVARHDTSHGPGSWRRLLDAIVADISEQPLLTAGELRQIDAPTLVVAGDRDPFVPIRKLRGWPARSSTVGCWSCPTSAMTRLSSMCHPGRRPRRLLSLDRGCRARPCA